MQCTYFSWPYFWELENRHQTFAHKLQWKERSQNYCIAAEADGTQKVSYKTFWWLWQYFVTMCPATDLCWFCQKGITKLVQTSRTKWSCSLIWRVSTQSNNGKVFLHWHLIFKMVMDQLPQEVVLGPQAEWSFNDYCHLVLTLLSRSIFLTPVSLDQMCKKMQTLWCCMWGPSKLSLTSFLKKALPLGKETNCVVSMW